jgi:alkylhydroperoxidase/carboxymuconolactone decarboxylase family protein YurZ
MAVATPTREQVLAQMRSAMGEIPAAIEQSLDADPAMLFEQARSSQFAMPPENGALDAETRTLVYLAVSLASSNEACTRAMLNKARIQEIPSAKLLEAFHIARFAQATQVVGNAEPLFEFVNERAAQANGGEQR